MRNYILFLLVSLAFISCSEEHRKEKAATTHHFYSDSLQFGFDIPPGMELAKNAPKAGMYQLRDSSGLEGELIQVWVEALPIPLSDSTYAQLSVTQLKLSNPGMKVVRRGSITAGKQVYQTYFLDFELNDGRAFHTDGYCFVADSNAYNITATVARDDPRNLAPKYEQVLSTFQVQKVHSK